MFSVSRRGIIPVIQSFFPDKIVLLSYRYRNGHKSSYSAEVEYYIHIYIYTYKIGTWRIGGSSLLGHAQQVFFTQNGHLRHSTDFLIVYTFCMCSPKTFKVKSLAIAFAFYQQNPKKNNKYIKHVSSTINKSVQKLRDDIVLPIRKA